MPDWGTKGISTFTPTRHSHPSPAIKPSITTLPSKSRILILGASRGIGAGIAHAYGSAGAGTLILCSRSLSSLHSVADECRLRSPLGAELNVQVLECDIADATSVEKVAEVIGKDGGALDVVVVNAGWSGPVVCDVAAGEPEVFRQVTETNYLGTYYAAHFLLPLLLRDEGGGVGEGMQKAFLAVGSTASFIVRGPIANTQYCVSKMAQLKLVEHVHEQYKDRGVLAVAIHPGAVMSQMAVETAPEEFMKYLTDDPGLCGAFCVWLTKEEGKLWLGGRHLEANWDVDELVGRKKEIVEGDLLKTRLAL